MNRLTLEELERFAEHDTLTQDELDDLLRRADSEPDVWIVTPGMASYENDPEPGRTYGFWHRPTGNSYGFCYAPLNRVWFKTADPKRP